VTVLMQFGGNLVAKNRGGCHSTSSIGRSRRASKKLCERCGGLSRRELGPAEPLPATLSDLLAGAPLLAPSTVARLECRHQSSVSAVSKEVGIWRVAHPHRYLFSPLNPWFQIVGVFREDISSMDQRIIALYYRMRDYHPKPSIKTL
jgi:hypothetical protein